MDSIHTLVGALQSSLKTFWITLKAMTLLELWRLASENSIWAHRVEMCFSSTGHIEWTWGAFSCFSSCNRVIAAWTAKASRSGTLYFYFRKEEFTMLHSLHLIVVTLQKLKISHLLQTTLPLNGSPFYVCQLRVVINAWVFWDTPYCRYSERNE